MSTLKIAFALCSVAVAAASQAFVIWDNTATDTSTTFRGPQDAPGLKITNANAFNVQLTHVAFEGRNHVTQNLKFFLADAAGNVLNSVTVMTAATGSDTMIGSNVNWTLMAGTAYSIAAISETDNVDYNFMFPMGPTSQNGLVAGENTNWSGFANPTIETDGLAEMTWRLEAVPEPATMTILALGAGALAARRRRA